MAMRKKKKHEPQQISYILHAQRTFKFNCQIKKNNYTCKCICAFESLNVIASIVTENLLYINLNYTHFNLTGSCLM